ncbi:MAG: cobyrinate a,c-diamide synthase [Desulfovibrio sp.]|uniref:cobyrinate a,c-diamide synthase n=1 Tax=Desulfovibrio sp. 7SRBS1 TaxID=3378064 RepID=UPI003B3FAF0F
MHKTHELPRLILAGLSGGAGKTIVSLGLCRAFSRSGKSIRPFKKGPDYIDAAWLSLAAGNTAANLDSYFMSDDCVRALFIERMRGFEAGIVEGNRGLFDGMDSEGSMSTASLARCLEAPLILVVDATKMTRTAAAIIQGVAGFEPGLNLAGVILNRTAGPRHRKILRESIERYTSIPVLGTLPKIADNPIPERHMGLWSNREMDGAAILDPLADIIADNVDLDRIQSIADAAPPLAAPDYTLWPEAQGLGEAVIGVVKDEAFWFYYPENIEALERAGATIRTVSLLDSAPWPELDGLYIGGGFPETLAERLSANTAALERVRSLSRAGMPIYAECGGFMYLARSIEYQDRTYPMAGVFPLDTRLCERPKGLGYIQARVESDTAFYKAGETIHGHEFHYSCCSSQPDEEELHFSFKINRGSGIHNGRDGLTVNNTLAGYSHIHALSVPKWAPRFVAAASKFRKARNAE